MNPIAKLDERNHNQSVINKMANENARSVIRSKRTSVYIINCYKSVSMITEKQTIDCRWPEKCTHGIQLWNYRSGFVSYTTPSTNLQGIRRFVIFTLSMLC